MNLEEEDDDSGGTYPTGQEKKLTQNTRTKIKNAINKIISHPKNADTAEKNIYNAVIAKAKQNNIPLKLDNPEFTQLYLDTSYEFVYLLRTKGDTLKGLLSLMKENDLVWKLKSFDKFRSDQKIEDMLIENPFDVEEGIHECVCGSKKTFSWQLQTSSSDEGMTNFVKCVKCKKQWKMR